MWHFDRLKMVNVFDNYVCHTLLIMLPDSTSKISTVFVDWDAGKPEDFGRVFSLLVKLPKLVKNKIFARRSRDSDFPCAP